METQTKQANGKSRIKRIALFVAATVALALGTYIFIQPRQLLYEGKSLNQWLDTYSEAYLQSGKFAEREDIERKMRWLGPAAVPPLVAAMQSKHPLSKALSQLLSRQPWQYKWASDLNHKCRIISMRNETAAEFLFDMGPDAAPAIPALLAAAGDTNLVLRANALNALGSIHQQPQIVVPVLVRALSNSWDRQFAVYSLRKFGTNAASATAALRALAGTGSSPDMQMSALLTLEKVAPDSVADLAMPVYLKVLKNRQDPYAYSVILSLLKLGPQAREAVPVLTEIAGETSQLGQSAAYALRAIDPEAAAKIWPAVPRGPELNQAFFEKQMAREETEDQFSARIRALGDQKLPYLVKLIRNRPASGNRITDYAHAAHALGELGPAGSVAIPDLTQAAGDSRWFVRVPAQAAIMNIKGEALLPVIQKLKDTSDSIAWYETAMLVAEFGTNGEPAIPVVIDAMEGGDDIIEGHGAILLGAIHRRPETCLPVLISLLDSPSMSSRQKAIGAISQFGDAAKAALPQIRNATDDFDPWIRFQARRLIKQLDPEARKAGIQ
ncbi:MAG: putative lyase [Pedosphaera sp.]|nr:putative lyase [Pedosphaera sp.]